MKFLLLLLALAGPVALGQVEKKGTAGLAAESNGNLSVGNAVTVRVYVEEALDKDAGWHLSQADSQSWIDEGSVLLKKDSLSVNSEANGSTRFDIEGVLEKPGTAEIKDVLITNRDESVLIRADGKLGQVSSVLTDEEKKQPPQWILPPVNYGGWNLWLIGIIILAALAGLILAARWLWLRRRKRGETELHYYDRAIRDLTDLNRQIKKTDRESQRRLGYALARIVREFSQGRFGIPATEMTDQEFIEAIRKNGSVQRPFKDIVETFENLDLLRYSKAELDVTVAPKLLIDIREFVVGNQPPKEEKPK